MAMIIVDDDGRILSKCALCDQILTEPVYSTSHFMTDPAHRLYRYSDASMHWECYANWPDRGEFCHLLFAAEIDQAEKNEFWPILHLSQTVLVTYGRAVNEISIILRDSGSAIRIPREKWATCLAGGWRSLCSHTLKENALQKAFDQLKSIKLPEIDHAAVIDLHNTLEDIGLLKETD